MNEERENLIEELHNIEVKTPDGIKTKRIGSLLKYWHLAVIADWIIADRKRTCRYENLIVDNNKIIKEVFNRAGIGDYK